MKLCSRCRSENNGDLKFCNYCGARLRTPLPYDAFGGPAPLHKPAQVVPISEEVTDAKLAYRYFLKGKHAFAAGDLDRATLMFQCALDANPADHQVKAFLLRVSEMKSKARALEGRARAMKSQYGLSSASYRPKDLALAEAREKVESKTEGRERLKVIRPNPQAAIAVNPPKEEMPPHPKLTVLPKMEPKVEFQAAPMAEFNEGLKAAPVVAHTVNAKVDAKVNAKVDAKVEVGVFSPVCRELLDEKAELKIPPRPKWLATPALEGREDFETLADHPISPSEQLDYAPESEAWKDLMASALVIMGLAVFGWVLVM